MLRIKSYHILVFVLYATVVKADKIQKLQETINKNLKIKATKDPRVLKVTVNKSEVVRIFHPTRNDEPIDKSSVFYTTVSCNIARWTLHDIYKFVKSSPLFYQRKFQSKLHMYEEKFEIKFSENWKSFVFHTKFHAKRFISILHSILDANLGSSFYYDTTILKALISLYTKIKLMSKKNELKYIGKSDYEIIRFFLEDMTRFQVFLSTHCSDIPSSKKNSQFYGYGLQIDDAQLRRGPYKFLVAIKHMNLWSESDNKEDFFLRQMLLEMFVSQSQTPDCIEYDICNATVTVANGLRSYDSVKIIDILNRVKTSYDPEVLFTYHNSVFAVIIKLIFSKILKILHKSYLSKSDRVKIEKLNREISNDYTTFPPYLAEGFRILAAHVKNGNTEDLNNFYEFTLKWVNVTNKCETWNEDSYLNEILTKLIDNIDELKCFQMPYKYINDKRKMYYKPFVYSRFKKSLRFIENNMEIDHSKQVCEFIINTYSMCFEALSLYFDDGLNDIDGQRLSFSKASKVLSLIRHYFLLIIQKRTNDLGLLKMAYNIAPLLVNAVEKSEKLHTADISRILNVIMALLNKNGLHYCSSSNTNFLLFNNVNVLLIGDHEFIEKSMIDFFQSNEIVFNHSNLISTSVSYTVYNYLSVKYLREEFIDSSVVFKKYGKRIKFYWNGQKKPTINIFKDAENLLVTSHHFYLLYDVYFKFYIAVIYFELKEVLNLTDSSVLHKNIKRVSNILSNFPLELNYLWSLVKELFDFLNTSFIKNLSSNSEFLTRINSIDKHFMKLNIVFENKSLNVPCFFKKHIKDHIDFFESVYFELFNNVPVVTDLIKKINLWDLLNLL